MAVDLLLLLGEGRRREPRRLAAEVPVALLLLEEGRRHEPRELAAPLVLLPLLRGGGDTNPANSLRRCAACSAAAGRGTTTPRPGAASVWRSTPPSRRCLQARRSRTRCPPGRPCRRCPPQHTSSSAAVPAVSPLLCFLGTVAVGRGRRVSSERLPYGQ